MKLLRLGGSAALAAGAFAASAVFASAADAGHGKTIAKRWCAACHLVSGEQTSASADVPSFADIAARRSEAKALANFLADPHPKMPDMHLTRGEIDDIVAYIRSLGPRPGPREPAGEKKERSKNE
jgi:mono/diheme cytochrome c family protein